MSLNRALRALQLEEEDWDEQFSEEPEEEEEAAGAQQATETVRRADSPQLDVNDQTCAICLQNPAPSDIAIVKGCEHEYCVNCILQWTTWEKDTCPQCKNKFEYLYVYKQLDGTMMDYPIEESVVLLKRARWFQDYLKEHEKDRLQPPLPPPLPEGAAAEQLSPRHYRDWADMYEEYVDEQLEEDEEMEAYYYSSHAGRARVVIGNRRWGGGGHISSGRMLARPLPNGPAGSSTPSSGSAKKGKAAAPATGDSAGSNGAASSSRGGSSSSYATPSRSSSKAADRQAQQDAELYGSSPSGSGRRAKRAARRAAMDAGADDM